MTASIFKLLVALAALPVACGLSTSVIAEAKPIDRSVKTSTPSKKALKAADFAEAQRVFDQYKKYDLANDVKLIDLYSDDATIEAGVERERGDIRWQKMDKAAFAREVTASFKDKHLSAMKSDETYFEPKFKEAKHPLNDKPAVEVIFHGAAGHAGIKVTWLLQSAADGHLLIASEKSVTYNKRAKKPD